MQVTGANVFVWLIFSHYLFDYPLQGDFLSKGKNSWKGLPGVPWRECLQAHCWLHACGVYFVTGNIWLGAAEYFAHWYIDNAKSRGKFGWEGNKAFERDQHLHVICKIAWALIWMLLHHQF